MLPVSQTQPPSSTHATNSPAAATNRSSGLATPGKCAGATSFATASSKHTIAAISKIVSATWGTPVAIAADAIDTGTAKLE